MATWGPRAVAAIDGTTLAAIAYRNQTVGFDPRSGEGARRFGGRFNPAHSFPVLYLCTTRACVVAELTRQAARQSVVVGALLPRELWEVRVDLVNVLDLTVDSSLEVAGLQADELVRDDLRFTQELGASAHEHGFQAILAPSATGTDTVLAIFPDHLAGAVLHVERVEVWSDVIDLPGQ